MDIRKISAAAAAALMAASFGCSDKKTGKSKNTSVSSEVINPQSIVFDWQKPYESKLTEFKASSDYKEGDSMFDVYDLTGDGTPELIISANSEPSTACQVYTLSGGETAQYGELGAYGKFRYLPTLKTVGYDYEGEGFVIGEYFDITDEKLESAVHFYNNSASASSGARITYEINGSDVALSKYDESLAPYKRTAYIEIGRKYTFGEDAVDYALHCSGSWGAVLSDAQKELFKGELVKHLSDAQENSAAFEVCDLDGNNIPELVISAGTETLSQCSVYYLQDGVLNDMGQSCGRDGVLGYDVKQKIFFSAGGEGGTQCWSFTGADVSGFSKSDSTMECGRKYLLNDDGILEGLR